MKRDIEGLICGKAANFLCILPTGSKHYVWVRVNDAQPYRVGARFVGRV